MTGTSCVNTNGQMREGKAPGPCPDMIPDSLTAKLNAL